MGDLQEIDWGDKVAASERLQAELDALTPQQAAERAQHYRKQGEHYLWLSALKRKQGHGDCSGEMAAADRHAHAMVFGRAADRAPAITAPRTAPRTRERRERHIARSTSSGDSDEDGSSDPPAPGIKELYSRLRGLDILLGVVYCDVADAWTLNDDLASAAENIRHGIDVLHRILGDLERYGIEVAA